LNALYLASVHSFIASVSLWMAPLTPSSVWTVMPLTVSGFLGESDRVRHRLVDDINAVLSADENRVNAFSYVDDNASTTSAVNTSSVSSFRHRTRPR
jgi:hypothetical protein